MKYHMRLDVAGAIRNKSFKGITDDQGRHLSTAQVRDRLRLMLANGIEYIPIGECDNFMDGMCKGHESE